MTVNQHYNELGQPIGAPMADWEKRLRPPRTPMEGRYCRVVPVDPAIHAAHLYDALCEDADVRNWTYLPYGPFYSRDDFMKWFSTDCVHDDPLFHAIIDPATDRPVGIASYLRIEPSVGVIEVGHIHYSSQLQRTPAATEAMFLMMVRAFDELGYRRYEWKCDAFNERSRLSALRLGFSFEGIFRQATIYKRRNRDTAWFSITNQDWLALRQAFQEWLSPENLSAPGGQKQRLAAFIEQMNVNK